MILSNLADVCRRSGLPVIEVPGWRTRGQRYKSGPRKDQLQQFESIETIAVHHTGTPARHDGDYPTLKTVRDGRKNLLGLLAQLGLGRSGTVYVIGAGVAWHAGETFYEWQNNWHAVGIEAEHPGAPADWSALQYGPYVRLCRTLADAYDVPIARVLGHKEIAKPKGRKPDPTFNMATFRRAVAASTAPTPKPPPKPPLPEDDMSDAQYRALNEKLDRVLTQTQVSQAVVEFLDRWREETGRQWTGEIGRDKVGRDETGRHLTAMHAKLDDLVTRLTAIEDKLNPKEPTT